MSEIEKTDGSALTSRQKELVDTLVADGGTHEQIAERMGTHRTWVTKTLHKQHVQAAVLNAVTASISATSGQAAATLSKLLLSKSDYVRLEAAKDVLDRAGFKPPDRKLVAVKGDVSINIDLS